MSRRKNITWITARQAADLLTKRFADLGQARIANDRHIRYLAAAGKIDSKFITPRQSLYSKEDIEAYVPSGRVGRPRKIA